MEKKDLHAIESNLWNMANHLRGKMDASEYKNYILAFMFYKYLSSRQNDTTREFFGEEMEEGQSSAFFLLDRIFETEDISVMRKYASDSNGFTKLFVEKKNELGQPIYNKDGEVEMEPVGKWVENYQDYLDFFAGENGYFISPFYSWEVLLTLTRERGIQPSDYQAMFDSFNFTLKYNKEASQDFEGIFSDVNLGDSKLGTTTVDRAKSLNSIVELVDETDYFDSEGRDILGSIYEYLIKQFAASAGKKGGEFYTPHEVSVIMAKIVTSPFDKPIDEFSVFDPTCGSGSLLLTVGQELPGGKNPGVVDYYGQELNTTTYNLARMNLMMNGVSYDKMTLRNADTLGPDWPDGVGPDGKFKLRTFDAVVANPPYSAKWAAPEAYIKDARFHEYGKLAPKSKADFAFLLDGLYHLNAHGIMTIVLPHGVLFRGDAEGVIREALIKKNRIDTVIGLPANLFYGTNIPTIILVLKKNKDNRDILFIDASQEFKKDKNKNTLTDENIRKIVEAYKDRKDIEKYAHVASYEEIEKNDFNLNIPRYVDTSEEEPEIDLAKIDQELDEVGKEIAKVQSELDKQFRLLGVKVDG